MSRIKIKNFGPIKDGFQENNGWIDISKVTVFIGNQGSGKSTVAKLISTFTWIEKAINRGDESTDLSETDFLSFFEYQRVYNYFENNTSIEYVGDRFKINYKKGAKPVIEKDEKTKYEVPKIMYVPAERNFLSAVENAFDVTNLPDTLHTFAEELRKAHLETNEEKRTLPIGTAKFKYNKKDESSFIIDNNFELNLLEASSGYQSFVPLYLVTNFLSDELKKNKALTGKQLSAKQSVRREEEKTFVMLDKTLSDIEKEAKIEEIEAKYKNSCFINIVEEPEQNLFPSSQWKMLQSLLEFNNVNNGNKLIITTHSPYLINYLSIAIQGEYLKTKIESSPNKDILFDELNSVIPENSLVPSDSVAVYQLDENSGIITKLPMSMGIPSDRNYLNDMLKEGNQVFDRLLEIEEKI